MDTITNLIEEAIKTPPVCQFCGLPKKKKIINLSGIDRIVYCVVCDCYEKNELRKQKEKEEEFLRNKLATANIGSRYADITLERLKELGTEYTAEAQYYVDNFNPKSGKGLHFIGSFGNGKTSLGHSIIKELIKAHNCLFITWSEFSSRCKNAESYSTDETIEQILKWITKFDLVMLDEFVINTRYETEINLACELFDRWYRDNKCFILINNPCDIEDMKKIPRLGKLLDRLSEQTTKLVFKNKSYRRIEE